ncbi:LLM class flavin-dependent oxidoreductase [Pseudonocardia kujensis]|uniref:LLM class flavin-dependent oxidoreductase n=1 Tax=Pseudonocardia kujensis TaxID=1128675 RepID=UPI001E5450D7|nr:LLM class flavin-dependent oxidoreductase [Pseudonocardia kujensis]MCE0762432.1 LLM class flavin-dependent oxidoreductase [Pseudonocardia kujensis]
MSVPTQTPGSDRVVPPTAARRVEFISLSHLNPSTELEPIPTRGIDLAYFRRYVRTLEEAGYDYTLLPYGSSSADSFVVASAVGQLTERIRPIVAVRPNTAFPLVVAQQLATLDQLTEGRAVVHLISGGNDAEQARQGDYLPKERRYARTSEFIELLRRAWTETASFSHRGEFYRFDGFGPGFRPYGDTIPISIGGQSDEAFEIGGRQADVFSFWGEPLADIRAQIERVHAIADAADRPRPRIWVTFRPIIDRTDQLAWRKAYDYAEKIGATFQKGAYGRQQLIGKDAPQNVGSQRALEFASRSEVYDRALWTRTAAVTNAGGASTALVGTPETVAAAIVDYIDVGADLVSIRGYDTLADARDYGRYVLPLVRQELAQREATGQRGTLQADHPGAFAPGFDADALAGAR